MEKSAGVHDEVEKVCPICTNEITLQTKACVKTCKHTYCYECISKWASTKRVCPLCNTGFIEILKDFQPDGSSTLEEFPEPTRKPVDEFDLSGLDHTYFLREVGRLLRVAKAGQLSYAVSQQNSRKQDFSWELSNMESIIKKLTESYGDLVAEKQFDPLQLYRELVDIQETMERIRRGDRSVISETGENEHSNRRYGANDFDDLSEDDEDEWDEITDHRLHSKYKQKQNVKQGRQVKRNLNQRTPRRR